MSQILYEAQEPLYVVIIAWSIPLTYFCHFIGVHMEALFIYHMAKALYLVHEEFALVLLQVELVFT